MCRTIKSLLKNKEVRRSSFQPNEEHAQSGAPARAIRRNSMPSRLDKRRQFHKSHLLVCGRRAAWGYGRDRDFGGDEVDHIAGFGRILRLVGMEFRRLWFWGSGSLRRPRTNRPTMTLNSLDW